MNVVQAMAPMTKYRPRAATIATYSQSDRPLGACSQSQFGRDHYLLGCRAAQVAPVSVLSVAVRLGPVKTAANGALAARSVRTT